MSCFVFHSTQTSEMILVWQADDGNPETFDDSDFYQQLLREFLESSDTLGLGGGPLLLSFLFNW